MDPIPTGHSDAVIITYMILGFIPTFAGLVFTYLKLHESTEAATAAAIAAAQAAAENKQRQLEAAEITRMHRELMASKMDENTKVTAETKEKASEAADTLKAVTETVLKVSPAPPAEHLIP